MAISGSGQSRMGTGFATRTVRESIRIDDLLGRVDDVRHVDLSGLKSDKHIRRIGYIRCGFGMRLERKIVRTPITCLAPAFAANIQRMPVPHPTSRTIFPLLRRTTIKYK